MTPAGTRVFFAAAGLVIAAVVWSRLRDAPRLPWENRVAGWVIVGAALAAALYVVGWWAG